VRPSRQPCGCVVIWRKNLAGWVARTRPLAGPLSPRGPQPVLCTLRVARARQWPPEPPSGYAGRGTSALLVLMDRTTSNYNKQLRKKVNQRSHPLENLQVSRQPTTATPTASIIHRLSRRAAPASARENAATIPRRSARWMCSQDQVQQQDAFEPLPFQLKLPGKQSRRKTGSG